MEAERRAASIVEGPRMRMTLSDQLSLLPSSSSSSSSSTSAVNLRDLLKLGDHDYEASSCNFPRRPSCSTSTNIAGTLTVAALLQTDDKTNIMNYPSSSASASASTSASTSVSVSGGIRGSRTLLDVIREDKDEDEDEDLVVVPGGGGGGGEGGTRSSNRWHDHHLRTTDRVPIIGPRPRPRPRERSESSNSSSNADGTSGSNGISTTSTTVRVLLMTLMELRSREELEEQEEEDLRGHRGDDHEEEEEVVQVMEEEAGGGGAKKVVQEVMCWCCVCMVREKGAAFIPCGHTFCRVCARELVNGRGNCPLCNASIREVLHIF